MTTGKRGQIPHEPRFKNANDELKAQWSGVLGWSMMFAVAAHAAAFGFWPGWDSLDPSLDLDPDGTEIGWISLYSMPSSAGGGGTTMASLTLLEDPDSLPAGVDAGIGVGSSELALLMASRGLRERLLGRGGPVPTIVEPDPASAPLGSGDDSADTREGREGEGEGVRVIVEDPMIADLARSLQARTLDLSRLSGLRPGLVLPGTSVWLLVRNPGAVEDFMRSKARQMDNVVPGEVDVTVWIDERGSVEWSEITRSSGRQEMDEVALALFNEVVSFRPARDQGVRVSLSVIFSVAFPW